MTTPAPPAEDHFVEVVETESGTVVECLGPMTENKADRVESGIQINMNHERYFTRTGTREALNKEAADRANPAATVAAKLGLKAAPGYEAELEDGQGLAALAVAAHDAETPIGAAGAKRLYDEIAPAARAEAALDHAEAALDRAESSAAADVLAAALEYAAAPRSAPRLRLLRTAAFKYGTLRNGPPKAKAKTKPKKGRRK